MRRDLLNTELLEAEILGAFFLDPSLVGEVAVTIQPEVFAQPQHRNLLKMIQESYRRQQELSLSTIATVFEKHIGKVGGISYISHLISSTSTTAKLEENVRQLIESDARRKAMALTKEYYAKIRRSSCRWFCRDTGRVLTTYAGYSSKGPASRYDC
ncbi:DnaB-like helicase N-terminal domain-containing protein [Paenibacillus alvei]|uniref:DnaB-like helicase N-terminal domain-containing protein n=1 Tax=Paenibacillus alvei TaxID=44250 RepID=UPI001F50EC8D|nr:DnaB-like helicase N-terminal domain-containing protein [Paenibacillus alvei]